MVNKPNLTVEIVPYVYKPGDEQPRKRKRAPKALDYKSIIQTRSQKRLAQDDYVYNDTPDVVPDAVPDAVPGVENSGIPHSGNGGDSDPTSSLLFAFLTTALFITALGALTWFALK